MAAVAVEIGPRPATLAPPASTEPDSADILIVDDVEALATGSTPGCNDDNPYR